MPILRLDMSSVVSLVLHVKLKEPEPPLIDKSILPLFPPKQLTEVVFSTKEIAIDSNIYAVSVNKHPLASEIVYG